MSRATEQAAGDTAKAQNAGYYSNAQNSYTKAQNDIGDYSDQLSKYKASNPFVEGGQFQTATNRVLANTADSGARSAGARLQGQALRTGGNTAGGIAATEEMERQGTRDLSAQEAEAQKGRIAGEAGYNKSALDATAVPAEMESRLATGQGGDANSSLGSEVKAYEQPGFWDQFGSAFAQSSGKALGSGTSDFLMGA